MKPLKFIHITKCAGTTIEKLGKKKNINWGMYDKEYGSNWHGIFPNVREDVKLKYDWFMVVRNPYERLISEFYCNFKGVKNLKQSHKLSNNYFNQYIKKHIIERSYRGNHYTEQYKYLDDNKNIKIHIIHFENIEIEFMKLMKKYNIDIRFDEHHNSCRVKKKFTIESFDPEVLELINEVYHLDFVKFGYKKIIVDRKKINKEDT